MVAIIIAVFPTEFRGARLPGLAVLTLERALDWESGQLELSPVAS